MTAGPAEYSGLQAEDEYRRGYPRQQFSNDDRILHSSRLLQARLQTSPARSPHDRLILFSRDKNLLNKAAALPSPGVDTIQPAAFPHTQRAALRLCLSQDLIPEQKEPTPGSSPLLREPSTTAPRSPKRIEQRPDAVRRPGSHPTRGETEKTGPGQPAVRSGWEQVASSMRSEPIREHEHEHAKSIGELKSSQTLGLSSSRPASVECGALLDRRTSGASASSPLASVRSGGKGGGLLTIIQELRDVVEGPLAAVLLWHLQASFPDCWEEVCTLVLPHAS